VLAAVMPPESRERKLADLNVFCMASPSRNVYG